MRLRLGIAALCCTTLLWGVPVHAATTATVGQLPAPNTNCGPAGTVSSTYLLTGVASGTPYTVPFAGVITSWSFHSGTIPVTNLKLKVGRAAGGTSFTIVGEAAAGAQVPNTINTYPASIPVAAGDVIGIHEEGGDCQSSTGNNADTDAYVVGDPSPGSTLPFGTDAQALFAVSATVAKNCEVPRLKGKKRKAARTALLAANCSLGRVKGHGKRVKKQSSPPGTVLPPDSPLNLRVR
jgi:hypothetical protein